MDTRADPQARVVPWHENPYRLFSWWDMAQFNGENLWSAIRIVDRVYYTCATRNAHESRWSLGRIFDPQTLGDDECSEYETALASVTRSLSAAGLPVSAQDAYNLQNEVSQRNARADRVMARVTGIQQTIEREMKTHVFLYIKHDLQEWYNEPCKGWDQVIARFPATVCEIEEASKCYALERYGAAVFHVMLVAEIGAIEIGKIIRINDPKPGWPATIREMTRIVRKSEYNKLNDVEKKYRPFLEQELTIMEGMERGWRHKISHVENKLALMTGEFSPQVAEEILIATRGFMRRLATEMP